MKGRDFYRMTGPMEWAGPPRYLSYSSLTAIERCPLQWQLVSSKYSSDLPSFPARPTAAAVEGHIIHSTLDKLFKSLSLIGLPGFGTPEFRECVRNVDIRNAVTMLVTEHEEKIAKHPRGSGFRLRSSSQQLTNQVIRLFKNQYSQVAQSKVSPICLPKAGLDAKDRGRSNLDPGQLIDTYHALTELYLKDDDLAFGGAIDLVWKEGRQIVIVDFKTGQKAESHMKQVSYYAVLWEKATDQLPSRIEVRYPGETVSLPLSETLLKNIEEELSARISNTATILSEFPAAANCDVHCSFCDVRQFCDEYWHNDNIGKAEKKLRKKALDIEVTVSGEAGDFGFEGQTNSGQHIAVVYNSSVRQMIGPFCEDDELRIIGANYRNDPMSVEIKLWTEVFHLGSEKQ